MPGFGPSARGVCFLLSLLKPYTRRRYLLAIEAFETFLVDGKIGFDALDDKGKDVVVAIYILDSRDRDCYPQQCTELLCALKKGSGNSIKFPTAWQVLEGWRQELPPDYAATMPLELAFAAVTLSHLRGRLDIACIILLCFTGVMRISEALG